MNKTKPAYVTGTGGRYRVIVDLLHPVAVWYSPVCAVAFDKYRVAQNLANAINAACLKRGPKS